MIAGRIMPPPGRTPDAVNPIAFQRKWRKTTLTERAAAQSHFNDLCELLGHPKPADVDGSGGAFTFERGVAKSSGGQGWADVWYQGHFAWEYKGPHKDLVKAYDQLLRYKDDLENPPLLVVSDLDRIEVHTNFTGTVKRVYRITLDTIAEPESQRVLRALFFEPEALRPDITPDAVTRAAAARFGALATGLQARGHDPAQVAHFLVQMLFCLFAEDIGLLPNRVFTRLLDFARHNPRAFRDETQRLLETMGSGGHVAYETIP
jgi:hypothetical protein